MSSTASDTAAEQIADQLITKHEEMPLKAFWEALQDPTLIGPEVPMAVLNHPSCGLERMLIKEEGPLPCKNELGKALEYDATPIIIAAQANRPDVVAALLDAGVNAAMEANDRYTAVHAAAANNDAESIELLIENGADEGSYQSDNQRTPLHVAAYIGHVEAIQALIAKKAQTEAYDSNGWTPMHLAAQNGHVLAIEALCDGGAHVNAFVYHGASPLHFAAHNNHTQAIEVLIAKGAEVNFTFQNGYTPLHLAAQYGHEAAIKALVDKNADTSALCLYGEERLTPWQLAERFGHALVVAPFQE